MKAVGVAIVGFGTVGQAAASILTTHSNLIAQRSGVEIRLVVVCRRSPPDNRLPGVRYCSDWREAIAAQDAEIIVETVGGTGVAREIVTAAITAGKPVVTANKALLAEHGDELFALASRHHVPLRFEAAVAGGVPVIRAVGEGAIADEISAVFGILNGTANYILTEMDRRGVEFETALREAQEAGYAEAEPSMDIDGLDARDKLIILARLAFGAAVRPADVRADGIRGVRAVDIEYARQLGSTIRLVGSAEKGPRGIELSVSPWLVQRGSMLAKVEGPNNAVFVTGKHLGTQMFYGPGAGGGPTGAAVVSDIVAIARNSAQGAPLPGAQPDDLAASANAGGPSRASSWYLRLTVRDRPGILAEVARVIAEHEINIDSVIQHPAMDKEVNSFVVTVEPVAETLIARAVEAINRFDFVLAPILLLRIVDDAAAEEHSRPAHIPGRKFT